MLAGGRLLSGGVVEWWKVVLVVEFNYLRKVSRQDEQTNLI